MLPAASSLCRQVSASLSLCSDRDISLIEKDLSAQKNNSKGHSNLYYGKRGAYNKAISLYEVVVLRYCKQTKVLAFKNIYAVQKFYAIFMLTYKDHEITKCVRLIFNNRVSLGSCPFYSMGFL